MQVDFVEFRDEYKQLLKALIYSSTFYLAASSDLQTEI